MMSGTNRWSGLGRHVMGRIVTANNASARSAGPKPENPRPFDRIPWGAELIGRYPAIRREWDAFAATGRVLPRIEQVLDEDQGNDGPWRAGLLMVNGRVVPGANDRFPATVAALRSVPGVLAALWSVLEPGTELPAHAGPNAGVLRFHLGIDCNGNTALMVDGRVVPYENGRGVLFDDTATHAAWNRGMTPRVTLMCELLRPLPALRSWVNRGVQRLVYADPRYRLATERAERWDRERNQTR